MCYFHDLLQPTEQTQQLATCVMSCSDMYEHVKTGCKHIPPIEQPLQFQSGYYWNKPRKFYCCVDKFAIKHFCWAFSIFILLIVSCSSAVNTKHIATFPLEQWLRERVTIMVLRTLPILLLGAFAKLRKAAFSFLMSVHPFFCPHGTTGLQYSDFHEILYFSKNTL